MDAFEFVKKSDFSQFWQHVESIYQIQEGYWS